MQNVVNPVGGDNLQEKGDRRMRLSIGPHHPSTHGVLQVIVDLEGETIVRCDPVPGYLHRGTEKLAENKYYSQILPLTDRLDYMSPFNNNLAYTMAVEKLVGVEVPERAQWIRVILSELQRIASHLIWFGTHVMDIGAITPFLWATRDRETIMDIFEMCSGARLTVSYTRIGGLMSDVPPGFNEKVHEFTELFHKALKDYHKVVTKNPIFMSRTQGVGVVTAEEAIQYGFTGPSLRGSGVEWDLRKHEPYMYYDQLDFEIPLGATGDSYDRYLVRMEEMEQSNRIIQQALAKLPSKGSVKADDPKIVLPDKELSMTRAEEMQRHFYQVIHGFPTPVGECYFGLEGPKGELGFYIISDGSPRPYRLKIRAPSYVNLQALPLMTEGRMIADLITCIGTIDIVLGEVDR
ncbi:NADH dehydrogenase (quinone) subunit D [Candidatus Chlorohelix allophototropha]|uniref:NADH-quinone oxidoreductase subunit D n=2 Tax=Candidatus Chlorohelix allophototropha TaxID=3003348 RepID=A0ABY9B0S8_9CHLR|nr:NADH dehydrogenase (quinone) subunit D [Chloroflexota bacterium L227-S17]